ncbi:MAG TPA: DUF1707 domain-containing protein [Longimicrobiaceae bacterium]|nr:DUF1707 domain-containing protein [Longimicrobiaceae bacterium]
MDRPAPHPAPAQEPLRERVVRQLCDHFAADNLDAEGLEERLDRAHQATSVAALQALVTDLPVLQPSAALASSQMFQSVGRADYVPERQIVAAIMGGASRVGTWTPPEHLFVLAVMGGAELDFRQARFGPGVTEISVFTLMGGVEIVVPPGVHVEMNGLAIMGAFEQTGRVEAPVDPNAPVLRIGGFCMMGGVEVDCRFPGEKVKDARKREKLEAQSSARGRLGSG